ncbi:MAG: hypothetical protein L0Y44_06815 [Phycisphaerales bacterium]|nr:hypothetical protein [Phycisphaerales bacterium]MCI0630351.1 hypothetical protein [Phycisphaerales bacterium]
MKHKTWFRLVIKAIGVLLIGLSITTLVSGLLHVGLQLIALLTGGFFFDSTFLEYQWPHYFGGAAQFVFGLYLFFGGKWIVNKVIPSNRPYCPECGYDLSKSNGANCPECGVALAGEVGSNS